MKLLGRRLQIALNAIRYRCKRSVIEVIVHIQRLLGRLIEQLHGMFSIEIYIQICSRFALEAIGCDRVGQSKSAETLT